MKRYWIGICLAILIGVLLRFYALGEQSYWIDEAYSVTLAQAIVEQGYPLLPSGEIIWRSPLYHYTLSTIVHLFGTAPLVTRCLAAGAGVVTIIALSTIAWQWFSPGVAVWVAWLTSLSYWEIAWSRQARMYIFLQLFFWLGLYCLERRRWWWAGGFSLLAIASHWFGAIMVVALWSLYGMRYLQSSTRSWWRFVLWYLMTVCIPAVIIIGLKQWLWPSPWVNYWLHYSVYLMREQWVLVILGSIGIGITLRSTTHWWRTLWLTGIGLTSLFILSYGVPLLHYRYIFFLWPVALLFAGVALHAMSQRRWWGGAGIICIVGLLLWTQQGQFFPTAHYDLESDTKGSALAYKSFTPQPNFAAAYAAMAEQAPTVVITPYPALTQLHYPTVDTYAMYIDLTGAQPYPTRAREPYTGVAYLTPSILNKLLHDEERIVILLDSLSEHRLDRGLQSSIQHNFLLQYQHKDDPWSEVMLYQN